MKDFIAVIFFIIWRISAAYSGIVSPNEGTEYMFSYIAKSSLRDTGTYHTNAKFGIEVVSNKIEFFRCRLKIYLYTVNLQKDGKYYSGNHEELVYDYPFVFNWNLHGEIEAVFYPKNENLTVLAAKKSLVGMLTARLHVPSTDETQNWSYALNETDHEGRHHAFYSATKSSESLLFTKTKTPTGSYNTHFHNSRVIQFDTNMKIPKTIKFRDEFSTANEAPKSFDPYEGMDLPDDMVHHRNAKSDRYDIPKMNGEAEGRIVFTTQRKIKSLSDAPEYGLVKGTLTLDKIPPSVIPLPMLRDEIRGNLTCMKKSKTDTNVKINCFRLLESCLEKLSEEDLSSLVNDYLGSLTKSKLRTPTADQEHLVDAIGSVGSTPALRLIKDYIIKPSGVPSGLVKRSLLHFIDRVLPKDILHALENRVFKNPFSYSDEQETRLVKSRLVLVFGLVIKTMKSTDAKWSDEMTRKMEARLGVYDPWHHRQKRSTLSENDYNDHVNGQATIILSLGNARTSQSLDFLASYVNNTESPKACRFAAVRSIANIKTKEAADVLLMSAMIEDTDHIKNAAVLAYSRHPFAELRDFNPDTFRTSNTSVEVRIHERAVHRVKRSFKSAVARVWKGFQFKLNLPGYNWMKRVGSNNIGGSFGIRMNNLLDINIQPLRGHLIVDVYDGAFATLHLGFIGVNFHIVKGEICFKGNIKYDVNILKEYGHDDIERFAKMYDNVVNKIVGTIKDAIKRFKNLIDSTKGRSLSDIFDELIKAVEDLPNRVGGLQGLSRRLIKKMAQYADPPPIVEAVRNLVVRVTTLYNDIRTDVMEFYNSIVDAVKVTLPWAAEQIKKAVDAIIKAVKTSLLTDPKKAIGDIGKAVIRIVAAIQGVISAKDRIADACFFTEGNRPYWFDIRKEASGIIDDVKALRQAMKDTVTWVKQGFISGDPALYFTGVTTSAMRQHMINELLAILDEVIGPFKEILYELAQPFLDAYDLVFTTIKDIKEAYNQIKNAYQESKTLIDKLFGPKASDKFPRKYLESTSCGDGFYPSTGRGAYKHQGVDAEIGIKSNIVAPFKGIARVSGENEVTIETDEIDNVEIIMNNVKLNSGLDGLPVFKGKEIGVITTPKDCSDGHVHVSMRKKGSSKYIDFSKYMERRPMPKPQWIQECNHYMLMYLGAPISYGPVTGNPDEKDTSHERENLPDTSDLPDVDTSPGRRKRGAKSFLEKAKNFTKALGLKAIDSLGPLFNLTMNKITLNEVLTFLEESGKEDLKTQLNRVLDKLSKALTAERCMRPDSLTDEQLRVHLIRQGKSAGGSRKTLIQRYVKSESQCKALQNILTKQAYCRFNKACMGIVCCLDVKLFAFYKTFSAFINYNPCTFLLSLGIEGWTKAFQIHDPNFHIKKSHPIVVDLDIIDPIQIVVEYSIQKSANKIKVSFIIRVCSTENDVCLKPIKLLDNAVITIQGCPDPTSMSESQKLKLSDAANGKPNFKSMTIGELVRTIVFMDLNSKSAEKIVTELRELYVELVKAKIDTAISNIFGNVFENHDVCLDGYTLTLGPYHKSFFRVCTPPIWLGPIPITFCIGAGGSYGITFNTKLCLLTMKAVTTVAPSAGVQAWGSVGVSLWVFRAELHLRGYIMTTSFPTRIDIYFTKFPLDVRARMDVVLVPLRLELRARLIVRICFWKCFKKTLINILLWQYSTPAIRGEIFNINDAEPDKSPPAFSVYEGSKEGVKERRSAAGPSCIVYQLRHRDYTEPAFNIELGVDDDRSEVTMTLCVGTFAGGCDVTNNEPLGGTSSIVSQRMVGGVPLYFTVTAANSGGGTAKVTCYLHTYDITPPTGRVTRGFQFVSHPNVLRGATVVLDDTSADSTMEGVGYGPGVYGDQVVRWHPIDIAKVEHKVDVGNDPLGLRTLEFFSVAREGKVISSPIKTLRFPSPQSCARECLAYSATKCQSFNYDYDSAGTCELLQEIEGHGVELHKRGAFHNFERLGIGHTALFIHKNLRLIHNNLYYFNVKVINKLGYASILTSVPILADFTPPEPGYCPVKTLDKTDHEKCKDFVHDPWEGRCIDETPLPNHRWIIDTKDCKTVFSGHVTMQDTKYTRANRMLSANWDGIHDHESGIHGYTWGAGRRPCEDDVHGHADPHAHLFHESEWTHVGIAFPLDLEDGHYHVVVRAFNKVDYGGPMAASICHSTPLAIDNTPPFVNSITNVRYDGQTYLISADFDISDPLSHIAEADFGLGLSKRDTYMLDWKRLDSPKQLQYTFKIPDGVPAWVKIRAINNVDLRTVGHANGPIIIDMSPPIAGHVNDGPTRGVDKTYQFQADEICSNWHDFFDEQSGISMYTWGVGTSPGLDDTVSFTNISHRILTKCAAATLRHNQRYYATVTAYNGGAVPMSVTVSSDGVTCDKTAPVEGFVHDGLDTQRDMQYSSSLSTVSANWGGYTDPESGIASYSFTIKRKHMDQGNKKYKDEIIHDTMTIDNKTQSIELHHFHLHDGDTIHVTLSANNEAGASTTSQSDGYVVDVTDPVMLYLGDGDQANQDQKYTMSTTHVSANWKFVDPQSGIDHYKISVYEQHQGTRRVIFPSGTAKPWITIDGGLMKWTVGEVLDLQNGGHYSIRVAAVNGAGLTSVQDTDGVIVDSTPPKMLYVRAGVTGGESEELIDGFVQHNDEDGLQVAWQAVDHQSSITKYLVSIGTAPGKGDVLIETNMGENTDSYIEVKLNITDPTSGVPIYYVNVRAQNGAGALSPSLTSNPIKVFRGDVTGQVYDGAGDTSSSDVVDVDFQKDNTAIAFRFTQFESSKDGIAAVEWAVGSQPLRDDVRTFGPVGVVFEPSTKNPGSGLPGSGTAQGLVHLQHGKTYYTTVRAITGAGNILEASSDGVTVDTSAPSLSIDSITVQEDTTIDKPRAKQYFQKSADFISAEWTIIEKESGLSVVTFSYGTYPGDDGVYNKTVVTGSNGVPTALVKPNSNGQPNILTLTAENKVGLKEREISAGVTIDATPPVAGTVNCPNHVSVGGGIHCSWTGFFDRESNIHKYSLAVGVKEGDASVFGPLTLPPRSTDYFVREYSGTGLQHEKSYYATVTGVNSVGEAVSAYSRAIHVDNTPPKPGRVVELDGASLISYSDRKKRSADGAICDSDKECLDVGSQCQRSLTTVLVAWSPFTDEETGVILYEVGVGTTPGGTQVKTFQKVPTGQRSFLVDGVDLVDLRVIYTTVRATNGAGQSSVATSNGVFISRASSGLQPLAPGIVNDGKIIGKDLDFQNVNDEISGNWDFSGDPCPVSKFEWSVRRLDGTYVLPFTTLPKDQRTGTVDELRLNDGETYFIVVRVTNLLGHVQTTRSDGITVQLEPLLPGAVRDGPVIGLDINFQPSTTTLTFNWDNFGRNRQKDGIIDTNGNQRVDGMLGKNQEIDHYEIAVGTDRRFPNTRTNIHPFIDVGLNTTWIFSDLTLVPRKATYYCTVLAISKSTARTEVTSNGIKVGYGGQAIHIGEIEVSRYTNSERQLSFSWQGFVFALPVLFYQWGISSTDTDLATLTCDQLQNFDEDGSVQSNPKYSHLFDIKKLQKSGTDTVVELTDLKLTDKKTYYIIVIATDESAQCSMAIARTTVDKTPPLEGVVTVGVFMESGVSFTSTSDTLHVSWDGYSDDVSGLLTYELALHEGTACSTVGNDVTYRELVPYIKIPVSFSNFTIVDLTLESNRPYAVVFRATNNAGSTVTTTRRPILVDTADPLAGDVKDGRDFKTDVQFQSNTDVLRGVVYHLPEAGQDMCPPRVFSMNTESKEWRVLTGGSVGTETAYPINYISKQLTYTESNGLSITMMRDLKSERMISGALQSNLDDAASYGSYKFDIKAGDSNGRLNAVTGVTFWEGSSDDFVIYDNCYACCTKNTTDPCPCDCNVSPGTSTESTKQRIKSFGIQIHPDVKTGGSDSDLLVLWSRSDDLMEDIVQEVIPISFGPTKAYHQYEITMSKSVDGLFDVAVFIDGRPHGTINGVTQFSKQPHVGVGVWARQGHVTDIDDPFNPPLSRAYIRKIQFPAKSDAACRYGKFFRQARMPIAHFFAGVGSAPLKDDVVGFRKVATPCIPCIYNCDYLFCDKTCDGKKASEIKFKLENLTLQSSSDVMSNGTSVTAPARYFLSVKASTGSGRYVLASSSGVYIDDSPPIFEILHHVDSSWDKDEPVDYQGTADVIAIKFDAYDKESEIAAISWKIGQTAGGDEIMPYRSLDVSSKAASVNGLKLNSGSKYYVTITATNKAGLKKSNTTNGVTVLLTPPTVDVSPVIPGAEPLPPGVYPPGLLKTDSQSSLSFSWGDLGDSSIQEVYFSVESADSEPSDSPDAIVPRQLISMDGSRAGQVRIENGQLHSGNRTIGNLTDAKMQANGTADQSDQKPSGFNMEPGKSMSLVLTVCNKAHKCAKLKKKTLSIIRNQDSTSSSKNGTIEAIDLKMSSSNTVKISTGPGSRDGTTIVAGPLSGDDVKQEYTSSAATDYKAFVVNPDTTKSQTSRFLMRRLGKWYGVSFYVAILGGLRTSKPLMIQTTFDKSDTALFVKGYWPRLLYWNQESQVWDDASLTCESPHMQHDWDNGILTTKVCGKPTSNNRRRRATTSAGVGGTQQFAVTSTSNQFQNKAPVITSQSHFNKFEDLAFLDMYLTATDEDGDRVSFRLNETALDQSKGNVSLESSGRLRFAPCADCFGDVIIPFIVTEMRFDSNPALSTDGILTIHIFPVNDNPQLVFVLDGVNIVESTDTGLGAHVKVEQNVTTNAAYQDLVVFVVSFDVDQNESLKLDMELPSNGTVEKYILTRVTIVDQDCEMPSRNRSYEWETIKTRIVNGSTDDVEVPLPCKMTLPHSKERLTWTMMMVIYRPDYQFYGTDVFKVVSQDKAKAYSELLTVTISVMENRCENDATCIGPANDERCEDPARSQGFDGYMCTCLVGYTGIYCETDIDDCQNVTCPLNQTCVDAVNGFTCYCDPGWPCSDQSLQWEYVVAIISGIFALTLIGIAVATLMILRKRKKVASEKSESGSNNSLNDKRHLFPKAKLVSNRYSTGHPVIASKISYNNPVYSAISDASTKRLPRQPFSDLRILAQGSCPPPSTRFEPEPDY